MHEWVCVGLVTLGSLLSACAPSSGRARQGEQCRVLLDCSPGLACVRQRCSRDLTDLGGSAAPAFMEPATVQDGGPDGSGSDGSGLPDASVTRTDAAADAATDRSIDVLDAAPDGSAADAGALDSGPGDATIDVCACLDGAPG